MEPRTMPSKAVDVGLFEEPKVNIAYLWPSYLNKTIVFLFIGYMGYYFCRNNIAAAFPALSEHFSFNNAQLGLIAFYSELSYSLAKFVCGPLADRIGGKKLFILGMLGAIFFNVVFCLGHSLLYFVVIWCCCRVFLSMGWGAMLSLVAKTALPQYYGKTTSFLSLSFIVGAIFSTLFAGFLIKINVPWQGVFLYPALILFFIMILCLIFIQEDKANHTKKNYKYFRKSPVQKVSSQAEGVVSLANFKKLLEKKSFIYLMLFSFFATFLRSILTVWMPKMFFDLGSSQSKAIFDSSLFLALGAVGTILVGWYVDKNQTDGRFKIMISMLSGLVFTLLFTFFQIYLGFQASYFFVISMGLCGFFLIGPYSMAAGVLSLDIGKKELAGSCTGFVDGVGYAGGAIALWFAGYASEQWGWSLVILTMVAIAILCLICSYALTVSSKKSARPIAVPLACTNQNNSC